MKVSALGVLLGAIVGLSGCGPRQPYVRYSGNIAQRAHLAPRLIEVHRTGPPQFPYKNLGTVSVTCPSEAAVAYGTVSMYGGCSYERAVQLARNAASEAGADGIHSIETGGNSAGAVVSLRASTFYYLPRSKPVAPPPPAPQADAEDEEEDVEERLRRLEKLKAEQLITPEEYTAKRAEILKEL